MLQDDLIIIPDENDLKYLMNLYELKNKYVEVENMIDEYDLQYE